jgi:hypothetical protein
VLGGLPHPLEAQRAILVVDLKQFKSVILVFVYVVVDLKLLFRDLVVLSARAAASSPAAQYTGPTLPAGAEDDGSDAMASFITWCSSRANA